MASPTDTLSDKEIGKLKEFKVNVAGIVKPEHKDDDHYLLRWLRARNFDIKKAQDMLQKHMAWRQEWGVDEIYQWNPPEVLTKYFAGGVHGQDKDGFPLYIEPFGEIDLPGLMLSAKKKDILRYIILCMENCYLACDKQSRLLGRRIDQVTVVEDWSGFGLKQMFGPGMQDILMKAFEYVESNYPEIMRGLLVINAPAALPVLWSMVKPFVSEDTKRKIKLAGKNYKDMLLENIDADQLPACYGGTLTDPDGNTLCRSLITRGGKVPEEYYLTGAKLIPDEGKVTLVMIKRGEKLDLEYPASKGRILRWTFWTEKGDLGFGVFIKDDVGELKEIEKLTRVDCHKLPEDGALECTESGTYLVRFDNSHSWMTGKSLHYSIEIIEQEVDEDLSELNINLSSI